MALSRSLWITVLDHGKHINGFIDRDRQLAEASIKMISGCPDAISPEKVLLFKLSLIGGKLYADRKEVQSGRVKSKPRVG